MSYKFKAGDRVEVVNLRKYTNGRKYKIKEGMIGTVIENNSTRPWVEFDEVVCDEGLHSFNNSNVKRTMCMWEDEIDFILPIIKKSDLRNGDITTYRNSEKRIVDKRNERLVLLSNFSTGANVLDNYDEDLFESDDTDLDIVKVYRPGTEETFKTERTKQVKEMTLNQVCKELGYEVKIVKEEN